MISEYMLIIKSHDDELIVLGKQLHHDDLIEKILDGIDDDYQPVIDPINYRDIPISFDKLHEKLINKELLLHHLYRLYKSNQYQIHSNELHQSSLTSS